MSFTRRAALASAALLMVVQPVLAATPAKPAAASARKAAPVSDFTPSADAIKAHMGFLADDLLEGREAGTRGYDIAANYVASQYALMHVKPAGDNGSYLQQVPLTAYRPANEGGVSYTGADGKSGALTFGEDYLPSAQARQAETSVTAPLVFVGYGIVAPERGRDDYAGLDVKGKIVVLLSGAPTGLQTEIRAHYSNTNVKRAEAAKRGAVGVLIPADHQLGEASPVRARHRQLPGMEDDLERRPGRRPMSAAPRRRPGQHEPEGRRQAVRGRADVAGRACWPRPRRRKALVKGFALPTNVTSS
jgi:hypothetical protein